MTTYKLNNAGTTGNVHEVDPISRIEGHLGIAVDIGADGKIKDANAHGNLWRGFENFLLGRKPNDAITFTQRICGVCPVPHGMTATYASDAVLGYSAGHITFKGGVSEKAMLIRNLVLASEYLMSSITHFYHLVAPSFVQGPGIPPWTPYFNDDYYNPLLRSAGNGVGGQGVVPNAAAPKLWDAVIISYVKALKMRRLTFEAGALFAGRMPMTSCYVAGGVSNDTSDAADFAARCAKFKSLIRDVGLWIVQEYVPIAFALGALYVDYDNAGNTGVNPDLAVASGKGYGAGLGRFLAWGAFPETDNSLFIKGGVTGPGVHPFTVKNKTEVLAKWLNPLNADCSVEKNLTEDIANSRYAVSAADTTANSYTGTKAYPGDVLRTKPDRSKGYSYMKTPLWAGKQCEVGPLARLAVAGVYPTDGTTSLAGVYGPIYGVAAGDTAGVGLNAYALSADLIAGLVNTSVASIPSLATLGYSNVAQVVADWLLPGGTIGPVKGGLSTMDRIRARALESLLLVQRMVGDVIVSQTTGAVSWSNNWNTANGTVAGKPCWIDELATKGDLPSWSAGQSAARAVGTWHGYGATEAPRGALMHQMTIENNKIVSYQCVVPTTWNGAPKSGAGENGAMEAAVIGAPWANLTKDIQSQDPVAVPGGVTSAGGIEVVRIAQSFDPCIACAVH